MFETIQNGPGRCRSRAGGARTLRTNYIWHRDILLGRGVEEEGLAARVL